MMYSKKIKGSASFASMLWNVCYCAMCAWAIDTTLFYGVLRICRSSRDSRTVCRLSFGLLPSCGPRALLAHIFVDHCDPTPILEFDSGIPPHTLELTPFLSHPPKGDDATTKLELTSAVGSSYIQETYVC